jgi:hypothetical protein
VRGQGFLAVADTLANEVGSHQAGNACIDVNHGTAREIKRALGSRF